MSLRTVTTKGLNMARRYHGGSDAGDAAKMMSDRERYATVDSRRRQEKMDAGMINEDHKSCANLPQGIVYREYPKGPQWMPDGRLDDTLAGIDSQIGQDMGGARKQWRPTKM